MMAPWVPQAEHDGPLGSTGIQAGVDLSMAESHPDATWFAPILLGNPLRIRAGRL